MISLHISTGVIVAQAVKLFPVMRVANCFEAREKLNAVAQRTNLGVGFVGTLGFVVGAAAAMSLVEKSVDRIKAKDIGDAIEGYDHAVSEMLGAGEYVQVEDLLCVREEDPKTWMKRGETTKRRVADRSGPIPTLSSMLIGPKTKTITESTDLVHDGSEWLKILTDDGQKINVQIVAISAIAISIN